LDDCKITFHSATTSKPSDLLNGSSPTNGREREYELMRERESGENINNHMT
jgi:hypothetical protein